MKRLVIRAGVLFTGAGLLLGTSTAAQESAAPSCPPAAMRVDTIIDTVFTWQPRQLRDESSALYSFRAAQERIALGQVELPAILGRRDVQPAWYGAVPPGADHYAEADVLVWFQLGADGRLIGMKLEKRSGWSAVNAAFQRALVRADSLRVFEAVPRSLSSTPVDLFIGAGFHRMRNATSTPIARFARLESRYAGDVVEPRLISFENPGYPAAAQRAGVGDRVLVEFVVDTTGRVVPESVRPVQAGYREFANEAVGILRSARFAPARIGRCLVPRRMTMPVNFMMLR